MWLQSDWGNENGHSYINTIHLLAQRQEHRKSSYQAKENSSGQRLFVGQHQHMVDLLVVGITLFLLMCKGPHGADVADLLFSQLQ